MDLNRGFARFFCFPTKIHLSCLSEVWYVTRLGSVAVFFQNSFSSCGPFGYIGWSLGRGHALPFGSEQPLSLAVPPEAEKEAEEVFSESIPV